MPKRQTSKAVKNAEEEHPQDVGDEEKSDPQVEEKKPAGRRGRKPKEAKEEEEKVPAKKQKVVKEADNNESPVDNAEVKKPGKRGRKPKEATDETEMPKTEEKKPAKNGQKVKDTQADSEESKDDDKAEEVEVKKPGKRGRKPKEVKDETEMPKTEEKKPAKNGQKVKDTQADSEESKDDDKPEEVEKKQPAKRGRKAKETKEDAKKSKLDEEEVKNDEEEVKNGEDTEETKTPVVEEKKPAAKGRKAKQVKEQSEEPKVEEKEEVKSADKEEEIKNGQDPIEESKNSVVEDKNPGKRGRKRKETKENGDEAASKKPVDDDKAKEDEKEEVEEKIPAKRGRKPKESKESSEPPATAEKELANKNTTDLSSINFTCDKLNKKGDKFNLKICSWNIGGARALAKKQGKDYIMKEDADIVVLQETKCTSEQLTEVFSLPGYKMFSQDNEKPGSNGVAFYSKKEPINVTHGLAGSNCDNESRIITAEYDNYFIICSYHPNAGRKLATMDKKMEWNEAFKTYVKDLDSKKPVIICGDLNVAHQEIDLKNPSTNEKSAGFTKQERDAMTELLDAGFVDTYRKLYPDATGAYTFWSYLRESRAKNTGWRLDYFLTSERIADNICDNVIRSDVYGSDHCPIVLFANL